MSLNANFIAFITIIRKEISRFMRIWTQTLLPPIITQSLYFVIFGTFVLSDRTVNGVPYIAFIVPGLVMMAVITSAFSNVVSSFFGAKFQRNVEELIVSPTSNWVILWGFVIGGVIRGVLVGFLVFLISIFFTRPHIENFFVIILFTLLTAVVFSLGGFLNALFAKKFDDVSIVPTFVLTPLTYLGGVFYSVKSLPPFWQEVSKFNPIVYMVDGFRYGFYGFSDFNIGFSAAILIVLAGVLAVLNWYLLEKGTGLRS